MEPQTTTDTATPAQLTPASVREARDKWVASMPATLTADEGLRLADTALADARAVVLAISDRWGTGTLPPPPWPAGPELVSARDRVKRHREGFNVLTSKGANNVHMLPAVGVALKRDGFSLYNRAAELVEKADKAPTLRDALKMLPDPRKLIFGLPVGLVVLGVGFLLYKGGKRRRFAL